MDHGSQPADYFAYWGKTSRDSDGRLLRHPLVFHCLDVAAVGAVLLRRRKNFLRSLSVLLGMPTDCIEKLIPALLALHDLGKFSVVFQVAERAAHQGSLPESAVARSHVEVGSRFWDDEFAEIVWESWTAGGGVPDWFIEFGAVFLQHHGRPADMESSGSIVVSRAFRPSDREAVQAFLTDCGRIVGIHAVGSVLASRQIPEPEWTTASWLVAGLVVLCDWIGSDQRSFAYWDRPWSLDRYWAERALPSAEEALAGSGVLPAPVSAPMDTAALYHGFDPTPLQAQVANAPVAAGPNLFILEDLTGSGKTEAAVALIHRLLSAGKAEGFFIALPTTATANAMYGRLGSSYRRLFDASARPSLILAHSNRDISEEFRSTIGIEESPKDSGYGAAEPESSSATCAAWLADNRKKALLAPAGVGTIDQVLLSVLRVHHQNLRMYGLFGKVLVVDEVHACDTYMVSLLKTVLEFHAAAGGHTVLLSATLPQVLRRELVAAHLRGVGSGGPEIDSSQFPALTVASSAGARVIGVEPWERQRRSLGFSFLPDRSQALAWVREMAASSSCVAWICNTVADAMEFWNELVNEVPPDRLLLFHARLALCDRLEREEEVLRRFGPVSSRVDRKGCVLVATQVVEQSLDLDFDYLGTDLAPIDLILQRAGRLRRHPRDPFGNRLAQDSNDLRGQPVLRILSAEPGDSPDQDWYSRGFPRGSWVYPHHHRLWLSARELVRRGVVSLPEDCRDLIEAVYGPDATEQLPVGLQRYVDEEQGKASFDKSYGRDAAVAWRSGWGADPRGWTGDEEQRTRLGEPTVTLRLARRDGEEVVPWAGCGEHRWRLSEITVRRAFLRGWRPPEGSPSTAALNSVRSNGAAWPRGVELVVLESDWKDGWEARGTGEGGREVVIRYHPRRGLEVG